MGSFFLLCDIYFDRLIQFTVEGHEIWVNAIKAVLLLLSSNFIHISHDALLIMKMYFLL